MNTIFFKSNTLSKIADRTTPINLYLKIRQKYKNCLLLESSDYDSRQNNSKSYICFNPALTFRIEDEEASVLMKSELVEKQRVSYKNFNEIFNSFKQSIQTENLDSGLFGYISYDAVQLFDNLKLNAQKTESSEIPTIEFSFYKHVLIFNHFNSNLTILEHLRSGETSELSEISQLVDNENIDTHKFELIGSETSNLSDEAFKQIISNGKKHCRRGDVFQIVLSRQFKQKFQGDDFQVYRALRSVNPSPYLFYFDYEKFRLFGSSPESQLKIIGGKAVINPIAGTYKRTGNMLEDEQLAQKLSEDKKENSEHVMLVDLARNDLSRNAKNVFVKTYKEVQYFSHVIHLVSEVVGEFEGDSTKIMADTFPAGTLSGAPKYKAMQLIDKYENQKRGFYGGAVGYIGLNNDINLAIAIRSFVSKNETLFFQAGAGVVVNSSEESELAEVNNKLSALKKAVELATKMSNNSQILS